MLSVYDSSFKILKNVIKEKDLFSNSLKKFSKEIKVEDFQLVSSLSGLFLRNYQFIRALSIDILKTEDVEPLIYIGLAFVNNAIKKVIDKQETFKYLASKLALYEIKFDGDKINRFVNAYKDKKTFLKQVYSEKTKANGFKYLSARNNCPEWVVTSLLKQYDKDIAIRTINALTKMPLQYALKNSLLVEDDSKLDLTNYRKIDDALYEFLPTSSIRKQVLIRNGSLIPAQLGEYEFMKRLPQINDGNVCFYFEGKSSTYPYFAKKYLSTNRVSLISPVQKENPELYAKIKNNKPERLDIYLDPRSRIITHLSEKQDLFVYMPYSSSLEQLRRIPEYGILFDTNRLDEILKNESEGLQDVTQYVNENGYLAYAVPTFNIKETLVLTKTFLEKNKDFTLEFEKIYFPFERENTVFYYAIFKRK